MPPTRIRSKPVRSASLKSLVAVAAVSLALAATVGALSDPQPAPASQSSVAAALAADPSKLTAPIATVKDKYELLPAFLQVRRGGEVERRGGGGPR